jgi:hypothetical protein
MNNIAQEITLEYLTKRIKPKQDIIDERNVKNRKERKFYRKRIINLTRDLLIKKQDCPEFYVEDITSSFDIYVKSCIHYFKALDENDILQKDLVDLDDNDNEEDEIIYEYNKEEDDKLLMRSIKMTKTLDNFIKKTTEVKKTEIILPKIKEIDIKNPELKLKGIKVAPQKQISPQEQATLT